MSITAIYSSPIGDLVLHSDATHLTSIDLPSSRRPGVLSGRSDPDAPVLAEAIRQLDRYFTGELKTFDLPLLPSGTGFQRRVWKALLEIPYGATATYGEIARRIGLPDSARAVGAANGRNPIPIVIPCHRVIGANGKLVGYGGGLATKQALLDLESSLFSNLPSR